jgi:hypothetical protein
MTPEEIKELYQITLDVQRKWEMFGLGSPEEGGCLYADFAVEVAKIAVAKEREECAKICDDWANGWCSEPEMAEMAAEIRARGQE